MYLHITPLPATLLFLKNYRYNHHIAYKSISNRGQDKLWVVSGCAKRSNPNAERGPARDGGRWASDLVQERAVRSSVSDIDFKSFSGTQHWQSPTFILVLGKNPLIFLSPSLLGSL
jgi:hypothetical protein